MNNEEYVDMLINKMENNEIDTNGNKVTNGGALSNIRIVTQELRETINTDWVNCTIRVYAKLLNQLNNELSIWMTTYENIKNDETKILEQQKAKEQIEFFKNKIIETKKKAEDYIDKHLK